jgi:hypothetical protein
MSAQWWVGQVKNFVVAAALFLVFGYIWDKLGIVIGTYVNSDGANMLNILAIIIQVVPFLFALGLLFNAWIENTNGSTGGQ